MKTLMSLKVQLIGLLVLVLASLSYCLFNGRCSLLTNDQLGYHFFKKSAFEQAAENFSDPMWQASAFFKNGNFEKSSMIFSGYDTPEAAFNQGNAQVMLGNYDSAVQRYQRALELRPNWPEAQQNLQIALSRQEMLKKEGGDMTGGMMGADEITFDSDKSPSPSDSKEQQVETDSNLSNSDLQAVWLRQVQTRPADFLRSKFAYQQANQLANRQANQQENQQPKQQEENN